MTSVKLINHSSSTADWNYYVCVSKVLHFYFKMNKCCFEDIERCSAVVNEKTYSKRGPETTYY